MELINAIVISIIVAIFITSTFIVVGIRNSIIKQKNLVKRAWADVLTYQLKKLKVIPVIEIGIQRYSEFEQSALRETTKLRNAIRELSLGTVDTAKLANVEQVSTRLLSGLQATFEAYPDLKTSELYKSYFRELSETQENITAAITIFNNGIQNLNNLLLEFPSNIVNSIFNKEKTVNEFTDEASAAELGYRPNF